MIHIPLVVGISTTKWVVNSWQRNKDISQIRESVMENYEKSVIIMDTFVAKLIFEYGNFEQKQKDSVRRKYPLSKE